MALQLKSLTFALVVFLLNTSCTQVFYQPDRNVYLAPSQVDLHPEAFQFQASDGTNLSAWHFKSQTKEFKGTLLQFHGNGQNMTSHFISMAWITEWGYDLIIFDYRGYGTSEGKANPDGVYLDSQAALRVGYERHNSRDPKKLFVVFGQSLGGAVALRGLDDFKDQSAVDLLVMDSSFASYQDVARRKLANIWLFWPFSPLGHLLVSDKYSAVEALTRLKMPVLFIHDPEDPVVPASATYEMFEDVKSAKELWTPHTYYGHCSVFMRDFDQNREKFLGLLNRLQLKKDDFNSLP